jgi:hypothetical protein
MVWIRATFRLSEVVEEIDAYSSRLIRYDARPAYNLRANRGIIRQVSMLVFQVFANECHLVLFPSESEASIE